MTRSRHPVVAFVLALLVVGVQYGGELHALEHVGEALRDAQGQFFGAPNDEVCAICALFAGGANALSDTAEVKFVAPDVRENTFSPPASRDTAAPSYYSSRAPPVFL